MASGESIEVTAMRHVAVQEREKSQAFFAQLAASIIPPHVGDEYRKAIQSLLLRAQEAEIYSPEKP